MGIDWEKPIEFLVQDDWLPARVVGELEGGRFAVAWKYPDEDHETVCGLPSDDKGIRNRKEVRQVWVNLYRRPDGSLSISREYPSYETAKAAALGDNVVATVLVWEEEV
jgi:hypothetical protein